MRIVFNKLYKWTAIKDRNCEPKEAAWYTTQLIIIF